ncbi:hypothetical protein Acr_00g0049990 [Actinidia rufa]|uniref:Uncharacterized protein n=1 Tax=Actinidia rufa TaxID=165716 RepID=A0A7J0DKE1_9ERIC|nr:hypothetical protein Acr_00g0049990 [Actinidia rufa]
MHMEENTSRSLRYELTSGRDHQGKHPKRVLSEAVEYGQGKRGRLAAASLTRTQDVLTGEDSGNAVVLDCGGFLHPELFASLGCPFDMNSTRMI